MKTVICHRSRPVFLFSLGLFITVGFEIHQGFGQSPTSTLVEDAAQPAETSSARQGRLQVRRGAPMFFPVHEGWKADEFPEHAMCYQTPAEIAAVYDKAKKPRDPTVVSVDQPTDGSLRIVATGHSFMAPGFRTLPAIAKAGGRQQQTLLTHVGGGITGSARYKWEQENGIFQFNGYPTPKLLASISGGKWDAMMWGPYYQDKTPYYRCWVEFCLKYNPGMRFYLSDAWPQLDQLSTTPDAEDELTTELVQKMHQEKRDTYRPIVDDLNEEFGHRVYVLPTSQAMVLAVEAYHRGELPGIEGIHRVIGGRDRSLWRDRLGHLGPGLEWLEGYVFFSTLYGRSAESIKATSAKKQSSAYPSQTLDQAFRKIAWQAVITDPLSGVTDEDGDGVADEL